MTNNSIRRKLKLEEVYEILRKKKESEIAKLKLQQEEEEMKHCTFQPNLGKRNHENVQDAIEKLYQHGVEKVRKIKNLKPIEEERPEQCTFKPVVNSL